MNIRKPTDYTTLFTALDAAVAAQLPQMEMYCEIGRLVSGRSEKGAAVAASEYLQAIYPAANGFSPRNVRRMRDFYRVYGDTPELLAAAMRLNWTQNVVIMEAGLTMDERCWYIRKVAESGLSEYSVVIKRAGGWRTESYNEFYMEKGNVLEQLPSFHWEKLFELQQSMSQSERLLALSVEFWMSAMDDLQEVLASEHLFEIIAALQTIGAHKYHDLLLKIMNDDFGDVRFPLDDNQIEQMQPKIEDANRAFWKNKGAEAEFRGAVTNFLITNLDASGHVFEGIDQS